MLAKGAPETMAERFREIPPLYEASYKYYALQGKRVLALGCKVLEPEAISKLRAKKREDVESDLQVRVCVRGRAGGCRERLASVCLCVPVSWGRAPRQRACPVCGKVCGRSVLKSVCA